MATIDYKQKIKDYMNSSEVDTLYKSMLNNLFPELAESEDERIRKELISFVRGMLACHDKPSAERDEKYESWIAWLEKQSKSSSTIHYWTEEEIEPIISDYLRGAEHYGGMIGRLRCLKPKSLEKQHNPEVDQHSLPVSDDSDLPTFDESMYHPCAEKAYEQNPAWSEGDKKMSRFIGNAITTDEASTYLEDKGIEVIDAHVWLESLKDRVQPQPKQEWSAYDKATLEYIIEDIKELRDNETEEGSIKTYNRELNLLQAINESVKLSSYTNPAEWSEEDKEIIDYLIDYLESELDSSYTDLDKETFTKEIDWLKSLKDRYAWKPSDEQMTALRRMKAAIAGEGEIYKPLNSLYEDLKKLREE